MTPGCFKTASAARSLRQAKNRVTGGKLPREGKMLRHGFSKSRHTWGMQDKYSSGPPYLWAQAHCLPNNESCMQAMVYAAMLELVCCDGNAERAALRMWHDVSL